MENFKRLTIRRRTKKLLDNLGQALTDDFISRLDNYKASTGKKLINQIMTTILNWYRKAN